MAATEDDSEDMDDYDRQRLETVQNILSGEKEQLDRYEVQLDSAKSKVNQLEQDLISAKEDVDELTDLFEKQEKIVKKAQAAVDHRLEQIAMRNVAVPAEPPVPDEPVEPKPAKEDESVRVNNRLPLQYLKNVAMLKCIRMMLSIEYDEECRASLQMEEKEVERAIAEYKGIPVHDDNGDLEKIGFRIEEKFMMVKLEQPHVCTNVSVKNDTGKAVRVTVSGTNIVNRWMRSTEKCCELAFLRKILLSLHKDKKTLEILVMVSKRLYKTALPIYQFSDVVKKKLYLMDEQDDGCLFLLEMLVLEDGLTLSCATFVKFTGTSKKCRKFDAGQHSVEILAQKKSGQRLLKAEIGQAGFEVYINKKDAKNRGEPNE